MKIGALREVNEAVRRLESLRVDAAKVAESNSFELNLRRGGTPQVLIQPTRGGSDGAFFDAVQDALLRVYADAISGTENRLRELGVTP